MKVFVKEPDKVPELRDIENTLEALQKIVGGYIESVTITEDLAVICNEEGRLQGLPYNCDLCGVGFVGPVVLVGVAGEEFTDVNEKFVRDFMPFLWDRTPVQYPEVQQMITLIHNEPDRRGNPELGYGYKTGTIPDALLDAEVFSLSMKCPGGIQQEIIIDVLIDPDEEEAVWEELDSASGCEAG